MSVKYRVRLENDRVIGPFSDQEIFELFEQGHISGEEDCQKFPIGNWKKLKDFPEIYEEIEKILDLRKHSKKVRKQQNTNSNKSLFNEFRFKLGAKVEVDYKELERRHRLLNPDAFQDGNAPEIEALEKTIVLKKRVASSNVDKTIILPLSDVEILKLKKKAEEEARVKAKAAEKAIVVSVPDNAVENIPQKDISNDKTEYLNIRHILPKINAELRVSEVELENKEKIEESEERHRAKINRDKKYKDELFDNIEKNNNLPSKNKKAGMSWIIAVAFIAIIYNLLYPDEEPKRTGPIFLSVEFPITKEFENKLQAKEELTKAGNFYALNTYLNKLISLTHYQSSVQNYFNGNPALGELILVYSELLENSKSEKLAANVIYKLIKISDKDLLKDVNSATGAALFYGKIARPNTGVNTIKNYLRLGSKPNTKMLAVYLDLLIKSGDFVEARKVYEKLNVTPKKTINIYLSLAKFLEFDEKFAEAQEVIEAGLKFYPLSVPLLLRKANYSLKSQSIENLGNTLNKIEQLNSERSPVYLAEFYQDVGMLKALKNKTNEAALFFKKSLDLKESEDLRAKLSVLDVAGNKVSQALILESKILALIKRTKEEIARKNWDLATTLSAEAIDANPKYVPAAIVLADLQLKRGLYEAAIHTLIAIKDKNPNNFQVLSLLIQTYLNAYKLDDGQRLLVESSAIGKYSQTPDYYFLYGVFFEKKGNIILAVKYYQEALKRNPVDDKIMFKLATIFYKNKKFIDSKKMLSDALVLDPKNTEYYSLYAQILNEQDNADTAIGYLRDLISDMGEDIKLLSTITSIYYKSGQIKEFKSYYKKIQQLPDKDEGLYEFLINASRLSESWDDYENYSKELLKINPGDLKTRMSLAEYYIEKNNLTQATEELNIIKEKLSSYPKIHYMLAKVFLNQGDLTNAKKMAEMELKLNPNLDSSFFIMAEVFRINKDYKQAVLNYEKAISKNGKSVESLTALGWIRLNQNLASEAFDLYSRALSLDPANSEVHRQLGFTYKALGQRAMAKEKFDDYLKLNPGATDRSNIEQIIRTLK